MTDPEQLPPAEPPSAAHAWARATMWIGIVLILAGSSVLLLRSCLAFPERALQRTSDAIAGAGQALATVASAFNHKTITTSFASYATTITNSQHLQFATLKQMEIFTRKEEPSTAFGYVPLPDVVVEARAPVEYTYYLDLNAKWDFVLRDGVLYVFAPAIRANKPAVDVSALVYEVKQGHFRTTEALDNLKGSISSLVVLRAKENLPLVREIGRRQTTDFVEKWLAKSFTDGKEYPVKVFFPGEMSTNRVSVSPASAR